ncbi:YolD-like family protein [Ruminococcus flavefaciens]|uniref:YolD-like family protein n=1 Tax=Ruminococcus flavefaciens TaxID=1265 RepID=UPI0013DD63DC|nr:YolD-like family protein [Ruminococcus flavefaciens]
MPDNYDDIKHLTRPQYDDLHPMSMHDKAAQFSPFAALVGYDDAVAETARLTDSRAELTEDEISELNANLNRLLDSLDEQPQISVTYFVPDEKKSGGRYVEKLGVVRIYDSYSQELVFTDGVRIAVADMSALTFIDEV